MSGQKYPLDLVEVDRFTYAELDDWRDRDLGTSFGFFDLYTDRIKRKFADVSHPGPSQKQNVPVLCRGSRGPDSIGDMHLDQPPPYRLAEDSASRKDDERAVKPHIEIAASPKKSRPWWRSWLESRRKKLHDPPQPTSSSLDPPLKSLMLSNAQGPRRIHERTDRPRQQSPIFKLPKPILVKIMMRLTPLSLWSLRQVSALFLTLFDDRQFYPFHEEVGLLDAHMKFSPDMMSEEERKEARAMLQPRQEVKDWCTACTQVRLRGEFEPAMIRLRELRFCDACGERHAGIFFPQESRERSNENPVCIGRLGKWELCSHMEPITWDSVKDILPFPDDEKYGGCPHPMHQPCSEESSTDDTEESLSIRLEAAMKDAKAPMKDARPDSSRDYCSFPRLLIKRWKPPRDSEITIKIGWDLPLLDIDSKDPPSTAGIRNVLQQLIVGGALRNHKTCPHMADGKALSDFISTAICDCFRKPCTSKIPHIGWNSGTPCECSRPRTQDLICEDCGAMYAWALTSGRITLIYRYAWSVYKPTSPAWLNLLDDLPTLAGIFHEKNKHIFWCDSPGCATGRDLRLWQNMVKEEMGLHHERYEKPGMEFCDWSTHLERSEERWALIGLPPRVADSQRPKFLHAVREAAKSEFR